MTTVGGSVADPLSKSLSDISSAQSKNLSRYDSLVLKKVNSVGDNVNTPFFKDLPDGGTPSTLHNKGFYDSQGNKFSLYLSDVKTPLDFGAIGDGIIDDTIAMNKAFSAGVDIYLPRGYSFLCNGQLTISNSITIYGSGKIIASASNTSDPFITTTDASHDIVFENVYIDNNSPNPITVMQLHVRNLALNNLIVDGVLSGGTGIIVDRGGSTTTMDIKISGYNTLNQNSNSVGLEFDDVRYVRNLSIRDSEFFGIDALNIGTLITSRFSRNFHNVTIKSGSFNSFAARGLIVDSCNLGNSTSSNFTARCQKIVNSHIICNNGVFIRVSVDTDDSTFSLKNTTVTATSSTITIEGNVSGCDFVLANGSILVTPFSLPGGTAGDNSVVYDNTFRITGSTTDLFSIDADNVRLYRNICVGTITNLVNDTGSGNVFIGNYINDILDNT